MVWQQFSVGTLTLIAELEAVVGQPCFNILACRVHQKPSSKTSITGHFVRDEVRDREAVRPAAESNSAAARTSLSSTLSNTLMPTGDIL
jgi:hypothetical protein